LQLVITGEYPDEGAVKIAVKPARPREFTLKLRIPEWSKKTTLLLNGEPISVTPGSYRPINRLWKDGDIIELNLDMSLAVIPAADGSKLTALRRGPVLLVRDSRLGNIDKPYGNPKTATLLPPVEGIKRAYQLDDGSKVCDYASAGNQFSDENLLRVFV
ncbi:MAG: glycoside hydrolase family 127 protein, partial [Victivallales bacterium]|nr:glycoside hydrolase family 127 protein [Victivallales bacterium]